VRRAAIALVHHPVLGRGGETLTTTITNLDLHDMARSARTYALEAFHVVHPLPSQRELADRIVRHWVEGAGGKRIPPRAEALRLVALAADLEAARRALGADAEVWTTAADARGQSVTTFADARARLAADGPPVLLCFGTGWGLTPALLDAADVRLEPIRGRSGYAHLSVRAACAIILDRLFG
jgi:hypothetical protein